MTQFSQPQRRRLIVTTKNVIYLAYKSTDFTFDGNKDPHYLTNFSNSLSNILLII